MPAPHDPQRDLSNLIRLGTVAMLDLAAGRCRVQTGEILTDYLPWLVGLAGTAIAWSAPTVGEQVVVLSPDGDTTCAVVLRGLYSDQFAAPSTAATEHLIRFPDGAVLQYDSHTHALRGTLPAGGTVALIADGGTTITGPLTVKGPLKVEDDAHITGTVTADADVVGGDISLKRHKHIGVTAGSPITGGPQ